MNPIELLAPARDLECGAAAIDCGADAVYIGAPRFGAREAAGNSLEDIAALARHAHKYWARVYVTLNTLLRDKEIEPARQLAWRLHDAGADGLIIQDTGLLECDLPPLPLIASTQMHNHTPERVAFLEAVGFRRAILARELTLEEIRAVRRAAPRIELECFVHGALCVGYSGQCALSYALGGRSGNRGQCAQPCRKTYTLVDAHGQATERGHLLSLRDLRLDGDIPALLDAGITSFKIEGRLKDRTYVANVVAHYRARIDAALPAAGLRRASSGAAAPGFTPDPARTFHRGATTYFLHGRDGRIGSPETPKMTGEPLGRVLRVGRASFTIDGAATLRPGDGLCFFDRAGVLTGTLVNAAGGGSVTPDKMEAIAPGVLIYRNADREFLDRVRGSRPERRIGVVFELRAAPGGILAAAIDEDGNRAETAPAAFAETAAKPASAMESIRRQFARTGETEFACVEVRVLPDPVPFLPVSALNALRREALGKLRAAREANRPRLSGGIVRNAVPYPERELTYLGNVLNGNAEAFYRRHGVTRIEPAAESGLDLRGRTVMTARYCIKHQFDMCPRYGGTKRTDEPLALVDAEGRRLELAFDCRRCEMQLRLSRDFAIL